MEKRKVVRAVDVGYGNVKYVLEHQQGSENIDIRILFKTHVNAAKYMWQNCATNL